MAGTLTTIWNGCYDDSWQGEIVPGAFSHPAKMSYGLLMRIIQHIKQEKWAAKGSVVLDPFGGIGSTAILGAYKDYQVVCIELEQKFVDLAKQNFKLHEKKWQKLGCPQPVIIQGDSRQLSKVIEQADIIVSSPPYAESMNSEKSGIDWTKCHREDGSVRDMTKEPAHKTRHGAGAEMRYGQTKGQLGAMKPGSLADVIISSPPYADKVIRKRDIGKSNQGATQGKHCHDEYGQTPCNLGNLKAGKVEVILSSPPYEGSVTAGGDQFGCLAGIKKGGKLDDRNDKGSIGKSSEGYGKSQGQLGQEQGEKFWHAAKEIVQECYKILRPGGHAIWVCKDFVRNKKRVHFSDDWQKLCESVGFKMCCRHKAILATDEIEDGLFGDIRVVKEDKSFFRRDSETKAAWRNYWKATFTKTQQQIRLFKETILQGIAAVTKSHYIKLRAQERAFIESGEHKRDWNKDVRIDHEDVICMKK